MDRHSRPLPSRRTASAAIALLFLAGGLTTPAEAIRREELKLHTARGVRVINTEITETQEEKALGLMFRTSLADDAGMLFFYETPQEVTMWMRNTYIPLDMVFIDRDGRVVNVAERTVPETLDVIPAAAPAVAVLEVPAGTAARLGIRAGARVLHPFFGTAAR